MASGANNKKRVLLIDGDTPVREALTRVLRDENYEVLTAANGQEAMQQIPIQILDAVVLDLDMPNENGWQTYWSISSTNNTLPILATTTRRLHKLFPKNQNQCAVVEKPFDLTVLLTKLNEILTESPSISKQTIKGFTTYVGTNRG